MPSGTAAGVSVLPAASALCVPAPPGVVVVPSTEPDDEVAQILGVLGGDRWLSVDEAAAELGRRRAAALEEPVVHARACRAAAVAARAAAVGARPGLATVPSGLTPTIVRSAARTVVEAAETLRAARDAVGARPGYDGRAARAAREAQADVERACRDRAAALPRTSPVLTRANLGAGALVLGRAASEAFDRAFFLVAVLPLGALGYAAHAVIAPARRARAAARRRWAELRSMNVSTMAGLAALEERAGAWERRAARVAAAEADFRVARDTWRSLVGRSVALASSERLAADLEVTAELDAAARSADDAWSQAVEAIQVVEDTAGTGEAPLVVLDPDPAADHDDRLLAVQRLAELAGATTVVVVVAEPAAIEAPHPDGVDRVGEPAAPVEATPPPPARPSVPAPVPVRSPRTAPVGDGGIVDLRERVKAGLLRLRGRAAPRHDSPAPDSVAAKG